MNSCDTCNLCCVTFLYAVVIVMQAYQRLLGDYRSEPVQVQALKDHQGNHGGLSVLTGRVRRSLWVHETDSGARPNVPLKSRHWSIIQPGKRDVR